MLLTLAEMRALFETDLTDAALQRLLDASEEEIVSHAGAHASATETFVSPLSRSVFLKRKAASITSVTERIQNVETVLAANDHRLLGERELVRRDDGTNARTHWGDEVKVVYAPVADLETRKRVQADLVKLHAHYNATRLELSGDFSQEFPAPEEERRALLAALSPGFALA